MSTEQERAFSPPIKEIILENFMSYEYARIPLNQGLNLIVGPNGAGKSSVLLAISVAFGQAYTERSRKLSDLIRRGKEIARVSLIFDNRAREGKRPIPYSKADTFMLSRYLRKDGSYWYEADYKEIDKSEVVRLLREFGINPDNLLIIMHQGMIEELGAISQEQRLVMVEEAVGFREYRERILSAEADLNNMVSEEGSLVQLIDNANQTIEYWKQIYDRYLEKKRLQEHRVLLEREHLWAQEGKLTRSLASITERLGGKRESLADLSEQQKKAEMIASASSVRSAVIGSFVLATILLLGSQTPSTHAAQVSSSLSNVLQWVDQAIAAAQRIRAATDAAEAARIAADLDALMRRISDEGLQQAQTHMGLILKTEGLLGAPR